MDSYFLFLLKKNTQFILTIVAILICVFALVESRSARLRAENPVLIAIDSNGTRLISRSEDPIFESEVTNFSRSFLSQLYNFTPQTFLRSVGNASSFMSEALWKTKEDQLLRLSSSVKDQAITLASSILKISELSDGSYLAMIDVSEKSRLKTVNRKVEVIFKLSRVQRNERNPWGIEVIQYDEKSSY